jgi:hypothetical protein
MPSQERIHVVKGFCGNCRARCPSNGIYDLAAAWQSDLVTRPDDRPGEKFLGVPLTENRKMSFEASPISYVARSMKNDEPAVGNDASRPAFLLAWRTEDTLVGPIVPQNEAFVLALHATRQGSSCAR